MDFYENRKINLISKQKTLDIWIFGFQNTRPWISGYMDLSENKKNIYFKIQDPQYLDIWIVMKIKKLIKFKNTRPWIFGYLDFYENRKIN